MKILIPIITIAVFFTSCNKSLFVQRKYTKGVFHERKAKPKDVEVVKNSNSLKNKIAVKELIKVENVIVNNTALASNSNKIELKKTLKLFKSNIKTEYGCGDTILSMDNKKIACKVHLVTEKGLSYRKCKRGGEDLLHIKLKNVAQVKYENGHIEKFSDINIYANNSGSHRSVSGTYIKGEQMAIAGFVLSFVAGLITIAASAFGGLLIAAISTACIILIATKEEYKLGTHLVVILGCIISWGLIISVLAVILIAIIALIVLAAML